MYHITTVTKDRKPWFRDIYLGRLVVGQQRALQDEDRADILCFVLMPDHVHWLMVLRRGTLADTVRLFKGRSARAIGHGVWQSNYYDHAVRDDEDLKTMARYIVANPLRARLVERMGDYALWDAVWLDGTLVD